MKDKVLAINFGGIGDQILFLSSLQEIKKIFPENKIFLMTETRSRPVELLVNFLDEENIIEFNYKNGNKLAKACEFVKILRSGGFKHVFCTGTNPLIPLTLFLSGIPKRNYIKDPNRNEYMAKTLFKVLDKFPEAKYKDPKLELDYIKNSEKILKREGDYKYIGLHPGVSKLSEEKGHNKAWNAKGWARLTERLLEQGYKVVILSGPEDAGIIVEIFSELKNPNHKNLIDLSYQNQANSLKEFAHIVSDLDQLICLDSSPMHIACALGVPTLALFKTSDHKKLLPEKSSVTPLYSQSNDWDLEVILKSINNCTHA